MKKIVLFFLGSLLLLLCSCGSKKDDTSSSSSITTEEAAQIVGVSLASNNNGVVDAVGEAANISTNSSSLLKSANSSIIKTDTITVSGTKLNAAGASVAFNSTKIYKLILVSNDSATLSIPKTVTAMHSCTGSVTAPLYTETHVSSGTFNYTNLVTVENSTITQDSIWTLNGTYLRTGTHVITTTAKSISHTITIKLTNLLVNKNTKAINGGTATVTITGSVKDKGSFSYTGTLVFNGSGVGTLTISGVSYLINLLTGDVTAK